MVIQGYWLPIIHAKIELNRKNPAAAVEMLQVTAPLEMNQEGGFYANYLRGEAFLRLRKGREAAAEFQKLLDHRALGWFPMGAVASAAWPRLQAAGRHCRGKSGLSGFGKMPTPIFPS
jgi:eukaryotic-like serine/threonine-protein kinase